MAAKKENDLIQAAVAARMAGKTVNADELAAQLPESVEAVPEYSVEDSKEKLLEIAAQLGVEVKKNASKAQIVAALDAEIEANTVDGETADALLAQKQAQSAENAADDTEDAETENDAEDGAQPVQEGEKLHGYVLTIHHGYTNLRRTPEKKADNVAQLVESGKRLEVEARVQGMDGQPWFRLLSGLYIVDDPTVTKYGEA
nr:MAG TPA: dimeris T4 recombination endonuclease VII [Caudoviricetes sp.]